MATNAIGYDEHEELSHEEHGHEGHEDHEESLVAKDTQGGNAF